VPLPYRTPGTAPVQDRVVVTEVVRDPIVDDFADGRVLQNQREASGGLSDSDPENPVRDPIPYKNLRRK